MIRSPIQSVALAGILGVSPFNPRVGEPADDDVTALAQSILHHAGVLQPLLLEARTSAGAGFHVVDGRRRWLAIQSLQRAGCTPFTHIQAEILAEDSDEAALRTIGLAANSLREPLHPVTEYEAFAALAAAGHDEATIARAFGLTLRRVSQALTLGRLAPPVRDAWRSGHISRDQAEAFALAPTHEQQAALFAELTAPKAPPAALKPAAIRARLLTDAIPPDSDLARFVGEAAYRAAGGRIVEDLFADDTRWLDGALAKRLAGERLAVAADIIATEEGWGFCVSDSGEMKNFRMLAQPLPAADMTRLNTLEASLARLAADEPAREAIEAEIDAIEKRAALQAITLVERGNLGVAVTLDGDRMMVTRGLQRVAAAKAAKEQPAPAKAPKPPAKPKAKVVAPPEPEPQPLNSAKAEATLRALLDGAINGAVGELVSARPDLALAFAVAALHAPYANDTCLALDSNPRRDFVCRTDLLRAVEREGTFERKLAVAQRRPLVDLVAGFAELVAAHFDAAEAYGLSDIAPFAQAIAARGSGFGLALRRHLQLPAYFAACSKAAVLATIAAIDVGLVADAKKLKRPDLDAFAATLAENRNWLPEPLAAWAALPPGTPDNTPERTPDDTSESTPERFERAQAPGKRSLAEAMDAAIGADGGG